MKIERCLLLLMAAAVLGAPQPKNPDAALGAARHLEEAEGNYPAAIEAYKKFLAQYGKDRALAAKALVRMGQCYEKLGDAEARKAYERVVREFGDQKDPAATARARLAALGRAGGLGKPPGITLRKVWALSHGDLYGAPSPDGRYHSFVDWDTVDLFLHDLVTGENRRLTNEGRWPEEVPEASVISGDGRQIAYAWHTKERSYELRVSGIDGSNPRTVYRDREFGSYIEPYQWTADGSQILTVLMKREPKEARIALIPAAGGPARFLQTQAKVPWYPSLSPDGRFLVYSSGPPHGILLLPIEGGQEVSLVPAPYGGWGPVWTPDGKKVLFISRCTGTNGLWAIEVVEGKPRGIPQLLKDGLGQQIRANGFTRQGVFYFSANTSVEDVYVAELDLTAGKVVREPAPIARRFVGSNSTPSWSPDGRRLAYYSRREWEKRPTLVILAVETGEAREVPVQLDQALSPVPWFPDGKSVLVSAWDSPQREQVAFYRVDTETGEHRLVRSSAGHGPKGALLSPDGRTVFFWTGGEVKLWGGLISRDIETGEEREIARAPYWAGNGWGSAAVSPDGRFVAFRSPVDEYQWTALRIVPATGGELRELFRFRQSETTNFFGATWTSDGRNVLFVRRTVRDGMPELWRIPFTGGEPQRTGLSMEGLGLVAPHPDGRRIAFDTGSREGTPNELWVLENIPAAAESKTAVESK